MARRFALCGLFFVAVFGAGLARTWFDLVSVLVAAVIFVTIFLLSYFTRDFVRTVVTVTHDNVVTVTEKAESLDIPRPQVDESLIGTD